MASSTLRTLALHFITLAALLFYPAASVAQSSIGDDQPWFAPTVSLGASAFIHEVWEDPGRSMGAALRGGVRLPYADLTALVEHWAAVDEFRISSLHLEGTYFFTGHRTLAPLVLIGIGYVRSTYQGERPRAEELDGPSAAYGVGLQLTPWRALGVRTEGVLRTDDGGYNGEVRILAGLVPGAPEGPSGLPDARADFRVYWMVPLSGPWRFVEPGYVLRFERPVRERLSGSLAFGLFHWQIPGEAFMRDYIWDTRAFVAMPGIEWHLGDLRLVSLRSGPLIVMMGEGPGNGVSLGTHLEAAVSQPWDLPISVGVGWLWMGTDDRGDSRVSGTDQNGLTFFGGVHF